MLARNQDIGARHTRAPSLRNGPSYTVPATHDVAINVRTRSASRTPASSPSTMPYTVMPLDVSAQLVRKKSSRLPHAAGCAAAAAD